MNFEEANKKAEVLVREAVKNAATMFIIVMDEETGVCACHTSVPRLEAIDIMKNFIEQQEVDDSRLKAGIGLM